MMKQINNNNNIKIYKIFMMNKITVWKIILLKYRKIQIINNSNNNNNNNNMMVISMIK